MAFIARGVGEVSPADIELINEINEMNENIERVKTFIREEANAAQLAADRVIAEELAADQVIAQELAQQAAKAAEAARQLAEQQKLVKPQRKPSKKKGSEKKGSKKKGSKKKGSEKKGSKKKDPLRSSVIDVNLGLQGLDDMDIAILRSLEYEQVKGKEATEKPFEAWINEFSEEDPVRAKLYNLFNGRGWSVINPRGDGFCGLYVAAIDFQTNHAPNIDPILIQRVLEIDRDGLIELIIDGMKKYYEARNRHIALGIPIPRELDDNKYFNVDDTTYEDVDIALPVPRVLRVSEDNFVVTEELLLNHKDYIRAKLRVLERLGNTPEALFVYLPYIYKRSYLILSYDGHSETPYLTTFMPCYADVEKDERDNAIYPYDGVTNSAIMFNNGHYFLLYNTNPDTKEEVINRILANKISDEPRRLWQQIFAKGRRLRKRKVKTHKQKSRPHKSIRRKVGTHKGRTQKALRRKHKHRTHTLKTH